MKTLFNPTNEKIEVVMGGIVLSVEPKSETEPLTDEQIKFWTKIHSFLQVKELGIKEILTSSAKEIEKEEGEIKAELVIEKKQGRKKTK